MKNNEIVMIYGDQIFENTTKLLNSINLDKIIDKKDSNIVLKPNLVLPQDPKLGATTHLEILVAIIEYLQSRGFNNIKIVESSWVGASTSECFKRYGYFELSNKYNVKLVDVKQDKYILFHTNGFDVEMSKEIIDCDFLISLPVLKGHCQTKMTCALKNMKGCISDKTKRNFHRWGLMNPIATLNSIKCADLVIVDSINGDLDFEEGGNPVKTDRIFAARDSVLCDAFSASLLGYEVNEVPYIKLAEELGVGKTECYNLINLNQPTNSNEKKSPSGSVSYLAKYIDERSACSACYGNLIHAIKRLNDSGDIYKIDKVCIGQEFRNTCNKSLIGVGSCTKNLGKSIKGCPPSANEMIKFLKNL